VRYSRIRGGSRRASAIAASSKIGEDAAGISSAEEEDLDSDDFGLTESADDDKAGPSRNKKAKAEVAAAKRKGKGKAKATEEMEDADDDEAIARLLQATYDAEYAEHQLAVASDPALASSSHFQAPKNKFYVEVDRNRAKALVRDQGERLANEGESTDDEFMSTADDDSGDLSEPDGPDDPDEDRPLSGRLILLASSKLWSLTCSMQSDWTWNFQLVVVVAVVVVAVEPAAAASTSAT
jgi:hypothetical protein